MAIELFHAVYDQVAAANDGTFRPESAATILATRSGRPEARESLLNVLRSPEAKSALYEDAVPFLSKLVITNRHPVTIWTQGEMRGDDGAAGYQLCKLQASGLARSLSPHWETVNGPLAMPFSNGGLNKLESLEQFWTAFIQQSGKPLPLLHLVDDRPHNIETGARIARALGLSVKGSLIDRAAKYPADVFGTDRDLSVYRSLSAIPIRENDPLTTHWVDLDYTLLDHSRVRDDLARRVVPLLGMVSKA